MAKKQTRRSISVSAVAFETAHAAAEKAGVSLSKFTEQALREFMSRTPYAGIHESLRAVLTDDPVIPPSGLVKVEEKFWPSPSKEEPTAFAHSTSMDDDESDGVQVVYDEDR